MKLVKYEVSWTELQDYLDKYQDKIKFVIGYKEYLSNANMGNKFLVIIDEE